MCSEFIGVKLLSFWPIGKSYTPKIQNFSQNFDVLVKNFSSLKITITLYLWKIGSRAWSHWKEPKILHKNHMLIGNNNPLKPRKTPWKTEFWSKILKEIVFPLNGNLNINRFLQKYSGLLMTSIPITC